MKSDLKVLIILLTMVAQAIQAATPGNAPALPITGTRIVNVATEPQLQTAMGNLQNGDTLLLANGTYNLTSSLYVNSRHNITIRGASGSTNVVLVGKGMDNATYGNVPFGIWSNGSNTTIAHLTIRDTYDNEIIFNPGAQSPHVYSVRLINAGSQFIKSNPTDVAAGVGVNNGLIEYCWFEYTGSPPADHGAGVGYFNGISAHAANNWIVRGNLFKNLHNPNTAAYLWNPSVLFWRHSTNTITEQNTFINVDRAVAYGLDNTTPYFDHAGGQVRNNFVYLAPGLLSPARRASSDGSLIAWNSPGTRIDHNTLLLNTNLNFAIEFRFTTTTNCTARNNLADAGINLRDSAVATRSGNFLTAVPGLFLEPPNGDLHLISAATNVIDKAPALNTITNDFDGETRPKGAAYDIGADEFTSTVRPIIRSFTMAGLNSMISFDSLTGVGYDLQRAPNATSGLWSTVQSNIAGTGKVIQITNVEVPDANEGSYRLAVPH
jgi:hypothetical protein